MIIFSRFEINGREMVKDSLMFFLVDFSLKQCIDVTPISQPWLRHYRPFRGKAEDTTAFD